MKIVCLLKIIPSVENFKYDYEKNIMIRENVKVIINPDDGAALEKILKLKDLDPSIEIEVVSMGPLWNSDMLKDIIRRGVDHVTLISDRKFQGSDTYSTSKIISKYLESTEFHMIVGGTISLDGDTGHVLPQIAESLDLDQFSHVQKLELKEDKIEFEAKLDGEITTLSASRDTKLVLGFSRLSKIKLRFVKFKNMKLDVENQFKIVTNDELLINENTIGLNGSPTKVVKAFVKNIEKRDKIYLTSSDQDIREFIEILKGKGVLKNV